MSASLFVLEETDTEKKVLRTRHIIPLLARCLHAGLSDCTSTSLRPVLGLPVMACLSRGANPVLSWAAALEDAEKATRCAHKDKDTGKFHWGNFFFSKLLLYFYFLREKIDQESEEVRVQTQILGMCLNQL